MTFVPVKSPLSTVLRAELPDRLLEKMETELPLSREGGKEGEREGGEGREGEGGARESEGEREGGRRGGRRGAREGESGCQDECHIEVPGEGEVPGDQYLFSPRTSYDENVQRGGAGAFERRLSGCDASSPL